MEAMVRGNFNFSKQFIANRIYLFYSTVVCFLHSAWTWSTKWIPTHTQILTNLIVMRKAGKKKSKGKKKKKVCSRPPSPVYVEVQVTRNPKWDVITILSKFERWLTKIWNFCRKLSKLTSKRQYCTSILGRLMQKKPLPKGNTFISCDTQPQKSVILRRDVN